MNTLRFIVSVNIIMILAGLTFVDAALAEIGSSEVKAVFTGARQLKIDFLVIRVTGSDLAFPIRSYDLLFYKQGDGDSYHEVEFNSGSDDGRTFPVQSGPVKLGSSDTLFLRLDMTPNTPYSLKIWDSSTEFVSSSQQHLTIRSDSRLVKSLDEELIANTLDIGKCPAVFRTFLNR